MPSHASAPSSERQPGSSSSSGTQGNPQTQMATAIATSLNLSASKVEAALAAVMPAAPSGTPPSGGTAPQGSSS
ncbi:MAG TPA: hypothetical protein VNT55_01080 [Baekduia sp.]|nr:hypothetical protein [Baekduia sp.]